MKLCFFNNSQLGLVEGNNVIDVSAVLESIATPSYPLPSYDLYIAALEELKPKINSIKQNSKHYKTSEIYFHSPVLNPGKIIAAPVNYLAHLNEAIADTATFSRAHVREIQETGLFLKATSSLVGQNKGVSINFPERRTDHEIELVAIIGKSGKNISADNALSYVAGYSVGLDITIRGPEERSLRKSLDSYTVLGPWLVTSDEVDTPHDLSMHLTVNDEDRQIANTKDLIMNVAELIEFASKFYTLEPGDLIYTGTPHGVGEIRGGDVVSAHIAQIGTLTVSVRNAP
ncbi:2-keto-4-pentenoate hydratase/2-oxohepta-3-ene-1,7-dioic acid hydratase (catechol pathway) [Pseudomonas sp. NFACC15-1]|uniref:fumarylacetoacetate hydrolase family protein n=1 Tax=unclassified Pseudomonas TaxID=196821 RepID=UPI00088C00CB|nr:MULTISPECIES: fumarylacetoacetate hydrolase family protein [unclassified Pseudomonas]SDA92051.1 2-keto-4-pentenoate hydratase/2-oxohepta-3-ene-1,7-dioic acid hydratase (catechol pathway) [Pseudomonas sp. NFACC15-1]SDY71480.1 2-keto-4-pentenoate hydratase/2-oxohepta-3-ene-1,7-dioic acid hydratase (catechol pathway) [Pseudomonas sp. NFACC14]